MNEERLYGPSLVDRRKARQDVATADAFWRLHRRVDDVVQDIGEIKNRASAIERHIHDISLTNDGIQSTVTGMIQQMSGRVDLVVRWCHTHDEIEAKRAEAEMRKEWIQAGLTLSNALAIGCFVLWLFTR